MVIRAVLFGIALVAAIPAHGQTTSVEDMAAQMEQIRANAKEIIGEETIKAMKAAEESGQKRYAAEIAEIQSYNQAISQQGAQLTQEMAGDQWDAALSGGQLPPATPADNNGDIPTRYRIFVTQRMSDAEIMNLVEMYRERPDVAIVLRGMLPGQTMTGVHSWMYRILQPIKEGMALPVMTMDPEPFNDLGVDQAPVIARYGDDGRLEAFALGMTSAAWIDERVRAGARGNLGAFGPTVAVGEEDIIQAMMRRAAAFDWERAAEGAVDRYWARTDAYDMPRVVQARTMVLDPTIEITQDIQVPSGAFIAHKGDRLNPLEMAPFHQTLLFFDPADAEQVQWVKAQVTARDGQGVVVMASQLRSLEGLEALGSMSDAIGAQIFQTPKEVIERFNVQKVPTLVRAEGTKFVIEEQLPSMRPKAN